MTLKKRSWIMWTPINKFGVPCNLFTSKSWASMEYPKDRYPEFKIIKVRVTEI